ncbi:MAG TPA: metallophosphoesterase [bacterium]|nr:metallophosphoesterase [bacterium]
MAVIVGIHIMFKKTKPYLIITDTHTPYHHKGILEFYKNIHKEYKCNDQIIHLGDLFDFHAISEFTKEPGTPTALDEYNRGFEFTQQLCKIFPKGVLVLGNHDVRPENALKKMGIPPEFLKSWDELLGLGKGWKVEPLYHVIKEFDVLCEHRGGAGPNGALNTAIFKRTSFAQGHVHSEAGVHYSANHNSLIFGMNAGSGADNTSLAMCYGKYQKKKGVIGCGIVFNGSHAEFKPMKL